MVAENVEVTERTGRAESEANTSRGSGQVVVLVLLETSADEERGASAQFTRHCSVKRRWSLDKKTELTMMVPQQVRAL
ncbi:hypothetical protein MRX96_039422 [Rhipicephalus microplus]